jgi:hypothetical protein
MIIDIGYILLVDLKIKNVRWGFLKFSNTNDNSKN